MRVTIEQQLKKFALFLDNHILKNLTFLKFFCAFFDFTSGITNFLLFNQFGYPLFVFLIGFFFNNYFSVLANFMLKIKLFGFSKILSIFFSMPFDFQFFIFFFFLFYQVVFLNTVLAYSEKITFFMKKKYHNEIMKELHYNSGLSTAMRSIVPATVAIAVFLGKDAIEAYKVETVSHHWKDVSETAIASGQTPPNHPVTITVHTIDQTIRNSAEINK